MKVCKVEGCGKKVKGYGLCIKHYHKLKRHGDPLGGKDYRERGTGNFSHGYKRNGQSLEHREIAEKALGKPLPHRAIVHHMDCNCGKDNPHGLVICQDQAHHVLIHRRMKALRESGNANYRKCSYCKQYDDPKNLIFYKDGKVPIHPECSKEENRQTHIRRKEKKDERRNQK